MKTQQWPFNTYLVLVAMVVVLAGCKTTGSHKKAEASVRLHLEVNPDGTDRSQTVSVGRSEPFAITVESRSFLNEFNLEKASVLEATGGFAISLQFNREGSWILEQYSTAHKGKRVAIAAEFGQLRWLAAPVMRERITNGLLVFTPDATREEAERIVQGVNLVVKRNQ